MMLPLVDRQLAKIWVTVHPEIFTFHGELTFIGFDRPLAESMLFARVALGPIGISMNLGGGA